MTQKNLIETIQDCWQKNYWDMGIYRWANRNLESLKMYFAWSFAVTTVLLVIGMIIPLAVISAAFVILIWVSAIDHFIIGRRIQIILRKLHRKGIILTQQGLMHYCKDILPK